MADWRTSRRDHHRATTRPDRRTTALGGAPIVRLAAASRVGIWLPTRPPAGLIESGIRGSTPPERAGHAEGAFSSTTAPLRRPRFTAASRSVGDHAARLRTLCLRRSALRRLSSGPSSRRFIPGGSVDEVRPRDSLLFPRTLLQRSEGGRRSPIRDFRRAT